MIDAKVAEWKDDKKMAQYLRPKSLFNATNFAQYSGQVGCANRHATDDPFRGGL